MNAKTKDIISIILKIENMQTNIIERYLRQELSNEELQDFTFQLAMDKELRNEVEANRMIFKTLKTMPPVGGGLTTGSKSNRLLWLGAIVILLVGSVFVYQQMTKQNQAPVVPLIDQKETTKQPIAFAPNESYEQLILADLHRGTEYTLKIDFPERENTLEIQHAASIQIPLKGNLQWNLPAAEFQFSIYSNKWEDYENESSVFQEEIKLKLQSENDFVIDEIFSAQLQPGIYYFLIETVEDGEPRGGGKFLVVD